MKHASALALLIPLLSIAYARHWLPAWPLGLLVSGLYLSEWLVWGLAASGRLPSWLDGRRYSLAEARMLPRRDQRPLLAAHFVLFMLAAGLLLNSFSFSQGRLFVLVLCFCQAQVLAHELSHARGFRGRTAVLYGIIGGTEGYLNHLRHHHLHYATPDDHLNLFFDDTFFGLGRRIRFQWRNARAFSPDRLALGYAWQAVAVALAFLLGGGKAVLAYGISVLLARLFIEAFSVITHYRLDRASQAGIAAWEVRGLNLFDYFAGYHVTRHPAHHAKGGLPPVRIENTPQMPAFLSLLTLVWLAPPLLRRVLDNHLRAFERLVSAV